MVKKKYFLLICGIMVLSLLFTFAGCSGSNQAGNDAGSEANQKDPDNEKQITISFSWWGQVDRNDAYASIADEFEADNPNIKIERVIADWGQYWTNLATQVAGSNAPDVMAMQQDYVSNFATRGSLLDLQPYVDSNVIDLSSVPKSIVDAGKVNDTLFMIAQGVSTSGYYYNKAVFDNLGVSYPEMGWTWNQFADKAEEIKKSADAKGIKMWGAFDDSMTMTNAPFTYWIRSHGEDLFSADGKIGFTEETIADWFRFWKDLRDRDIIPDAATAEEHKNTSIEQTLLAKGEAAFHCRAANNLPSFQNAIKDGVLGIVTMPRVEGQQNPEYLEGAYLTVFSGSKNPEIAAKFIDYFVNNTKAQKIFKAEQGMPASTKAIEAISPELSEAKIASLEYIRNTVDLIEKPYPYPPNSAFEIRTRLLEFASAVAFERSTPDEAAAEFMEVCRSLEAK